MINRQILLVSRPKGEPTLENFTLIETPVPDLTDGQVLVRHAYLSLDPYMRGRMDDAKSYAPPQVLNEVMIGGTVGEVIASLHPTFAVGDQVAGMGGWQEYAIVNGNTPAIRKIDTSHIPISAYLGAVGMPGVTAWYGLNRICEAKAGQTIVVSAASGAVGSIVGQLAKAKGCRAVGFAGGAEKCHYVTGGLGFDACIDYKAHADPKSLYLALKEAITRYRQIVDQYPRTPNGPLALYHLGNTLVQANELSAAIEAYQRFLGLYGSNSSMAGLVQQRLAYVYLHKGDRDQAVKALTGILETPGTLNRDQALFELARLEESQSRPEGALARYQELIKTYPNSPFTSEATIRTKIMDVKKAQESTPTSTAPATAAPQENLPVPPPSAGKKKS